MTQAECDLIVIGAGPGGYELAAASAARGMSVTIIERDHVGGTCLNRGCIPTKCLCAVAERGGDFARARALVETTVMSLRQDIDNLLKHCTRVSATAAIDADGRTIANGTIYTAKRTVIATGSAPASLPIAGAELAITSDDLLRLETLPSSICIIGGGVIGLEMASALKAFGTEVTVVEYADEILPGFDKNIAKRLRSALSRRGINIKVSAAAQEITTDADGSLNVRYTAKSKDASVKAAAVLMAVGRRPVTPDGLAEAGIDLDSKGHIIVDQRFETSRCGIYAIGDCCSSGPMLAHVASAQARAVNGDDVNLDVIPSVVFTTPRVAMTGMTAAGADAMLASEGCPDKAVVSKVPYGASGYARACECTDGFMMAVSHPVDRRLLGFHIIGAHADDLIVQPNLAIACGMTADDILKTIYPHPTLSELIPAAIRQDLA